MFYELYDWNFSLDEKEYHLINLNEVLQIDYVITPEDHRNPGTGKAYKIYKIKVYFTDKSYEWTFYYRSESERYLAYEGIKQAMRDYGLLPKVPENPNDVSNILKEEFHPLEDLLRNSPLDDVPEVKLCE